MTNNIDCGIVFIDSTEIEFVNGTPKKVLLLKSTPQSCMGWYHAKVIEVIGIVHEYFFPDYISCLADANEGNFFQMFLHW